MQLSKITRVTAFAALVFAAAGAMPANAKSLFGGTIPEGAVATDPVQVYRTYAGKTADWGRGSYAYWGTDQSFIAVNQADSSIAVGEWYVTSASRMCFEAKWYWRQDFGVESDTLVTCTHYRTDENGEVWSASNLRGPWFPFSDDNIRNGDRVTRKFNAMVKELGIAGTLGAN